MDWKSERGFSFIEILMVATVLSFVTAGAQTFVSRRGHRPTIASRKEMVGQGRASMDQMVRELELAGHPPRSSSAEPDNPAPANSNPEAATFLVAAADQVVFEADLDGNGVVERVEYRLHESALWRSAVSMNPDGSVPPIQYELWVENVDNRDTPLFRYTTDPLSQLPAPGNINSVRVSLLLRPPVLDSKRPQFNTLRFDAMAHLEDSESGTSVARARRP